MATSYQDIFDIFLLQVEDYRLVELYRNSPANLTTYLTGFLILAIPEFIKCNQDLTDRNDTTYVFGFDMSDNNKKILSKLMVKEWLGKEIKDILQMRWNITDTDFKHYSEAQNTKSKQDVFIALQEECSQLLMDYYNQTNDWGSWINSGIFYVP